MNYTDGKHDVFSRVERPQLVFGAMNTTTFTFSDPLFLFNGVCRAPACLFISPSIDPQPGAPVGKDNNMSFTLARPLQRQAMRTTITR